MGNNQSWKKISKSVSRSNLGRLSLNRINGILYYLSIPEILLLSLTCKYFYKLTCFANEDLWSLLLKRDFRIIEHTLDKGTSSKKRIKENSNGLIYKKLFLGGMFSYCFDKKMSLEREVLFQTKLYVTGICTNGSVVVISFSSTKDYKEKQFSEKGKFVIFSKNGKMLLDSSEKFADEKWGDRMTTCCYVTNDDRVFIGYFKGIKIFSDVKDIDNLKVATEFGYKTTEKVLTGENNFEIRQRKGHSQLIDKIIKNDKYCVTSGIDNKIFVWDKNLDFVHKIKIEEGRRVEFIDIQLKGNILAISFMFKVCIWDLKNQRCHQIMQCKQNIRNICFVKNFLVVSFQLSNELELYKMKKSKFQKIKKLKMDKDGTGEVRDISHIWCTNSSKKLSRSDDVKRNFKRETFLLLTKMNTHEVVMYGIDHRNFKSKITSKKDLKDFELYSLYSNLSEVKDHNSKFALICGEKIFVITYTVNPKYKSETIFFMSTWSIVKEDVDWVIVN